LAVYSNRNKRNARLLDESCPLEERPEIRGEAYCFAKVKQEQILTQYGERYNIPYVILRPGNVFGAGKSEIVGRIGLSTFGVFLHLGGSNPIPFTYVDNCADAIALGGLVEGIEGEAFNIIDDDVPSSRAFLRAYKNKIGHFNSIYVPHFASHFLCYLWEKYSEWSSGQLPPAFNRWRWHAYWKPTTYSNKKIKARLGWTPSEGMAGAVEQYFDSCMLEVKNA
jgi:nucleoside-diphosphate-sugar epimerase